MTVEEWPSLKSKLHYLGNICFLDESFRRFRSGEEYMIVLRSTKKVPMKNEKFGENPKNNMEMIQDPMILNDVAKTFSTLSAYLTTMATMRPPAA